MSDGKRRHPKLSGKPKRASSPSSIGGEDERRQPLLRDQSPSRRQVDTIAAVYFDSSIADFQARPFPAMGIKNQGG